ncbi:plasmid mobilization protein [Amycolatopsis vancoresmycina]
MSHEREAQGRSRRSEQRQRTALVALRLLPEERELLESTARSRGMSLSEFLRVSAMSAVGVDTRARPA